MLSFLFETFSSTWSNICRSPAASSDEVEITLPISERRWLVEDDDEAHDLAVSDLEVVREDQFLRQVRLVVVTVIEAAHDGIAIVINNLTDLDRHVLPSYFFLDPATDRVDPNDFTLHVIDVGVLSKGCDNRLGIKSINGADVFRDDAG